MLGSNRPRGWAKVHHTRLRRLVRAAVGERGRALITRAMYATGQRPRVNRAGANSVRYPGGRRAALLISADLELAWAWRYARGVGDPLAFARRRARHGRRNLPLLLDLCDAYDLPVTWATVGHLFLESCAESGGRAHPELPRVPYFRNAYWSYRSGDWFDADPGSRTRLEADWPLWYGPDLVRSIRARRVRHEIGCHTFSHVVFSDGTCPASVAQPELQACQSAAAAAGLALRSFAFPGNLPGNRASLKQAGFVAYRWHDGYELDVPRRDDLGLWRIPGGACLERPSPRWSTRAHQQVLRRYVDRAIELGLVCGLWFHPEAEPRDIDEIVADIFAYVTARRSDLWVTTMGELADWMATAT